MLISFYRICFSLTDLHHESKLLGKTTIKKHDHFFTVEADGLCSSSVSTGDVVVMGSFTAKVTRTVECRHGVLFVEIDRPAQTSSGKNDIICRIKQVVRLRGKKHIVPVHALKVHDPIQLKFNKKKGCLTVTAQSLNVNAGGYLTIDGFVSVQTKAELLQSIVHVCFRREIHLSHLSCVRSIRIRELWGGLRRMKRARLVFFCCALVGGSESKFGSLCC